MSDGSCQAPCYDDDEHCNLTVVKIFLAAHGENKVEPPILQPLNEIIWHGETSDVEGVSSHVVFVGHGPPRDRTTQRIVFEHTSLSLFITISLISAVGLLISCSLFAFNLHFRSHR